MAMDNSRHKANLGKKYSLYFNLLRKKIEQYEVEAHHIYNMDEKGFMLRAVGRLKRIFSNVRVQRINHRCKVNSDVFVRVSEETGVKVLSSLA
jgi:hypothetical protein